MVAWFSHASGIIIMIECVIGRPESQRSSATSSNEAESEAPGVQIGYSSSGVSPSSGLANCDWRARIQLRLPLTVLISPLWAMVRNGCARGHDGKVFVEKREWTMASFVLKR